MLAFLRHSAALTRAYICAWCVTPHHAVLSIAGAIAYLAVMNQSFVVTLTSRVAVGVHTKNVDIGRRVREELMSNGLSVVAYAAPSDGLHALSNGALAAFVDIGTNADTVTVSFAGRNPLMDRELANVLFGMTARLAEQSGSRYRLHISGNSYTPDAMRAFVTANLVPFLLLSLIIVNCGFVQVMACEDRTLFSLLVTPASRGALLVARLCSGTLVSLAVFVLGYCLCMPLVGLPTPARPLAWLALCILQMLANGAVYLCLALLIRRYIPFAQFGLVSVTLLIFAGGGVTPFEVMPQWERIFASCTPALYMIRSMRAVMLGTDAVRLNDLAVMAMWGIAGSVLAHQRLRSMVVSG